jgi:hypothetical protein
VVVGKLRKGVLEYMVAKHLLRQDGFVRRMFVDRLRLTYPYIESDRLARSISQLSVALPSASAVLRSALSFDGGAHESPRVRLGGVRIGEAAW